MKSLPPRPVRRGGFTLLEVLLVLAILGVIAAMVVPNLLGTRRKAMEDASRQRISALEQTVRLYAMEYNDGEYPQGRQEVISLMMEPSVGRDGRQRPPLLEELPTDAWGEVLYYEYPSSKTRTDKPAIWSSGPNRRSEDGGGDDVNNWLQQGR